MDGSMQGVGEGGRKINSNRGSCSVVDKSPQFRCKSRLCLGLAALFDEPGLSITTKVVGMECHPGRRDSRRSVCVCRVAGGRVNEQWGGSCGK
jgi:hypothetical protein